MSVSPEWETTEQYKELSNKQQLGWTTVMLSESNPDNLLFGLMYEESVEQ